MSWKLKEALRSRLARESGAMVKDPGGKTSVALVYPNTYSVGMGNLAIHSLYRIMNSRPDLACERFFLPDRDEKLEHERTKAELFSAETQRPLSNFAAAAFSLSFENDLLNLLPILALGRIPHRAKERGEGSPILVAGGAAPTLNPRPLGLVFDAVALGEAECFSEDLVPLLAKDLPKGEALSRMAEIPGVWVPSLRSSPDGIEPRRLDDLDPWPTETVIHSDEAEFGGMHLVELQRGCPFRCSFCATPSIYGAPRMRSFEAALAMVKDGLPHRKKFGLIGAHILSWPHFAELAKAIHGMGASFSPSSVRAGDIDGEKAELLAASGHRSVALGIEAGSETLRDRMRKKLSDEEIFRAVEILASAGITNLRLYFMIGLPGEKEEDVEAIASLSFRVGERLRAHAPRRARQTSLSLTLSPFVPKPGTPFADEPFAGEAALKEKAGRIKALVRKTKGLSVGFDSTLSASIEAYLSRADEGALEFLEKAAGGVPPRRILPC